MSTEEIFAKRDMDSKTLTVTHNEECWMMMECKIHEYEYRGNDFYFRGYRVIVKE